MNRSASFLGRANTLSAPTMADPNFHFDFNKQGGIRRVVTGFDDKGGSIFVSDDRVPPITFQYAQGGPYHKLWGGDEPPSFPDDGKDPNPKNFFPAVGPGSTNQGHRFWVFEIPVDPSISGEQGVESGAGTGAPKGNADPSLAAKEMEEKLPGMLGHMEHDNPGMHRTDTCDMLMVLSGSVSLELDYGLKKESWYSFSQLGF